MSDKIKKTIEVNLTGLRALGVSNPLKDKKMQDSV